MENRKFWDDSWTDSRIAYDGLPTKGDVLTENAPAKALDSKFLSNWHWVRGIFWCAIASRRVEVFSMRSDKVFMADTFIVPASDFNFLRRFKESTPRENLIRGFQQRSWQCVGIPQLDFPSEALVYIPEGSFNSTNADAITAGLRTSITGDAIQFRILREMPLSFRDQVRLFGSNAIFLMPRGDKIANIILMSSQSILVEVVWEKHYPELTIPWPQLVRTVPKHATITLVPPYVLEGPQLRLIAMESCTYRWSKVFPCGTNTMTAQIFNPRDDCGHGRPCMSGEAWIK